MLIPNGLLELHEAEIPIFGNSSEYDTKVTETKSAIFDGFYKLEEGNDELRSAFDGSQSNAGTSESLNAEIAR